MRTWVSGTEFLGIPTAVLKKKSGMIGKKSSSIRDESELCSLHSRTPGVIRRRPRTHAAQQRTAHAPHARQGAAMEHGLDYSQQALLGASAVSVAGCLPVAVYHCRWNCCRKRRQDTKLQRLEECFGYATLCSIGFVSYVSQRLSALPRRSSPLLSRVAARFGCSFQTV